MGISASVKFHVPPEYHGHWSMPDDCQTGWEITDKGIVFREEDGEMRESGYTVDSACEAIKARGWVRYTPSWLKPTPPQKEVAK